MANRQETSNADLVYEVLRSAQEPLTFQQIFDRVNAIRPVATKNPKATIRGALQAGHQLISLGDGRYCYLPRQLPGSLLRLPLLEKRPTEQPLVYPEELYLALWPSFHENEKRRDRAPVAARLPDGQVVSLALAFLDVGTWGTPMPAALRGYLEEQQAVKGDSLLVRIVGWDPVTCELRHEPRRKRNARAVKRRNAELADEALTLLQQNRSQPLLIWELIPRLLARGVYHADIAPDPLTDVLTHDNRFFPTRYRAWALTANASPEGAFGLFEPYDADDWPFAFPLTGGRGSLPIVTSPEEAQAAANLLVDLAQAVAGGDPRFAEDTRYMLSELLSDRDTPTLAPEVEEAQELMYDAWESPSPRERVRLARRALKISPDCADAHVLLAQETARTAQQARDLYAQGVAAGERALGPTFFEQHAGHFWGLVQTRPYMRARHGLALTLWETGQRDEAIQHAWEMLRLNPNDNQGVRYSLLNWLLETSDPRLESLFQQYPDDWTATWLYGRALDAFRTEGDSRHARKLRSEALTENRFVPAYLTGQKPLPEDLPDTIGMGDEDEAIDCAAGQLPAWRATPGALPWLEAGQKRR
jgi:tetratricopeptide (TPR) repeat protein